MKFTKMHGLGNDYLYVYGEVPQNIKEICTKLSDRHFGAGSDGMIYISGSGIADFRMRIFNADGSEANMCGNGIRCVGKYVFEKGYTKKENLRIETLSGIKYLHLKVEDNIVKSVTVDMGSFTAEKDISLKIDNETIVCTPVCVGNYHAVVFTSDISKVDLYDLGPKIEKNKAFPDGVNVEFVQILSNNRARMRVWERGSGVTLACGTGACASVAASICKGFYSTNEKIYVELDGGTLEILIDEKNHIKMTGPAEFVYEGEVREND